MRGFAVNLQGAGMGVTGVVQVDQVSALDMVARKARASGEAVPDFVMDEVLAKLAVLIQ
jgi:mRNA interferase MazF/mRNA interferase ChpB